MLLWFGPFILLATGTCVLIIYLKRRRKSFEEVSLSEKQLQQADILLKKNTDGDQI